MRAVLPVADSPMTRILNSNSLFPSITSVDAEVFLAYRRNIKYEKNETIEVHLPLLSREEK